MAGAIDQLIVNKPYEEPTQHWRYEPHAFSYARTIGTVEATIRFREQPPCMHRRKHRIGPTRRFSTGTTRTSSAIRLR